MSKVTIIEIDLDANIEAIVSEGVVELTSSLAASVNQAIEIAKQRDALLEERKTAKATASNATTTVMEEAYQKLVNAGPDGVLCTDIMSIVASQIPTPSAFALRMKTILRDKGNEYALSRTKRKGNAYYVFNLFNAEDSNNNQD